MKKKLTILGAICVLIILMSVILFKTKEIIVFTNYLNQYEEENFIANLTSIGDGKREILCTNIANKRYFRMYDDEVGKEITTYDNMECEGTGTLTKMFCVEHYRAIILRNNGSGQSNLRDEHGNRYETGVSLSNHNIFKYDKSSETGFFALYESYMTIKDTNTNFAYALVKISQGSSYYEVQNAIWRLGQMTNCIFDGNYWFYIDNSEVEITTESDVITGKILQENKDFVKKFADPFETTVTEEGVDVTYNGVAVTDLIKRSS